MRIYRLSGIDYSRGSTIEEAERAETGNLTDQRYGAVIWQRAVRGALDKVCVAFTVGRSDHWQTKRITGHDLSCDFLPLLSPRAQI